MMIRWDQSIILNLRWFPPSLSTLPPPLPLSLHNPLTHLTEVSINFRITSHLLYRQLIFTLTCSIFGQLCQVVAASKVHHIFHLWGRTGWQLVIGDLVQVDHIRHYTFVWDICSGDTVLDHWIARSGQMTTAHILMLVFSLCLDQDFKLSADMRLWARITVNYDRLGAFQVNLMLATSVFKVEIATVEIVSCGLELGKSLASLEQKRLWRAYHWAPFRVHTSWFTSLSLRAAFQECSVTLRRCPSVDLSLI